jgi:hypothetical protein
MGLALLALLNNAHSFETAIISWDQQEEALTDAVRLPVEAFASQTARKRRVRREQIDRYPSTQAKLRLGEALVRDKPPGKEMRIWVPDENRDDAMRIVADEVVVEKRTAWIVAANGLRLMSTTFEDQIPILAAAGRIHSTPDSRTKWVEDMADLFRQAGTEYPQTLRKTSILSRSTSE